MLTRRDLLLTTVGAATLAAFQAKNARSADSTFQLWAFSDAHVGTDDRNGRKSLAEAIAQSEFGGKEGGPPFDWDIAINAGDTSGAQRLPLDEEGQDIGGYAGDATQRRLSSSGFSSGPRSKASSFQRAFSGSIKT